LEVLKIADGGGRNLEEWKNRHISPTKFGMMMQFDPSDCSNP